MIRKIFLIFICTAMISTAFASSSYIGPKANLDLLKKQIYLYHSSGGYDYDISKVAGSAMTFIKQYIGNQSPNVIRREKIAIVLDIDETSLSNFQKVIPGDDTVYANDKAIAPTLRLYRYVIKHGITVFFITGRTEPSRQMTLKNLIATGYTSVSSTGVCEDNSVSSRCTLYLRNGKYISVPAMDYKPVMRKRIEQAGYTIIASIGDQYSDLGGGYSIRVFKYPNYMYYTP